MFLEYINLYVYTVFISNPLKYYSRSGLECYALESVWLEVKLLSQQPFSNLLPVLKSMCMKQLIQQTLPLWLLKFLL